MIQYVSTRQGTVNTSVRYVRCLCRTMQPLVSLRTVSRPVHRPRSPPACRPQQPRLYTMSPASSSLLSESESESHFSTRAPCSRRPAPCPAVDELPSLSALAWPPSCEHSFLGLPWARSCRRCSSCARPPTRANGGCASTLLAMCPRGWRGRSQVLAVLRPPRRRRHLLGFQYDGQPREDALALAVFGQLQLAGKPPAQQPRGSRP